jgi:cell division protein FtsZ
MTKQVNPEVETFARIKVVGVGGSGGNAINHMMASKVKGVEFIAVNTDAQDLHHSLAKRKIHIGKNLTKGLGTGMNPELGKRAADETKEEIQEGLKGADMVFIAGGMGGGTGTGASSVVAKTARELGALTVGVVTKPFFFEGAQRMRLAVHGLEDLQKEVDALIVIPNDRLLQSVEKETTAREAFSLADEVLREAVEGISDLITTPGIINVDFADIRAIMENAGSALMGIGKASGDNRAVEAAKLAINSPLLDVSVTGAKGVLFAIAGGDDLTMHEIQEAAKVITETIDADAKVIFGAIKDEKLKKSEVKVTVIASGFPEDQVISAGSSSLFQLNRDKKEEVPLAPKKEQPERKGIFSNNREERTEKEERSTFFSNRDENKDEPKKKEEVKSKKPDIKPKDEDDDNDDWSGVPAFLRRSKLK